MDILLDSVLEKLDFVLPFVRKYVDDLITAILIEKLQPILNVFSSYDLHIQFTHELEMDKNYHILLIQHQNQRTTTEWYSLVCGRFLDILLYHPKKIKLNVAKNSFSE